MQQTHGLAASFASGLVRVQLCSGDFTAAALGSTLDECRFFRDKYVHTIHDT